MANYLSRDGKLIELSAVSLPTEIIQCIWLFRSAFHNSSRRITAKCLMSAVMIVMNYLD